MTLYSSSCGLVLINRPATHTHTVKTEKCVGLDLCAVMKHSRTSFGSGCCSWCLRSRCWTTAASTRFRQVVLSKHTHTHTDYGTAESWSQLKRRLYPPLVSHTHTHTYRHPLPCPPSISCAWCTSAKHDHRTDPGGPAQHSSLSWTHTHTHTWDIELTRVDCLITHSPIHTHTHTQWYSPPPLFAFFVRDGNKEPLITHINQRTANENKQINKLSPLDCC